MSVRLGATLVAVASMLTCSSAWASERLYWNWAHITDGSVSSSGIAVQDLGSGHAQDLPLGDAPVDHPLGVVPDTATGTLYWANFGSSINYCYGALVGGQTISFDGPAGGGTLNTAGATVSGPDGLAIDPVARRLYWANDHANSISYARLDGSGGRDLNTSGATLDCPAGLVVDPAIGRVYWSNLDGDSLSYAALDGSGGGTLDIPGVTVDGPWGLAIDQSSGRIYWANFDANTIAYANLDGSGGGVLNTGGATVSGPWGVALDPAAGRIYWTNNLAATVSWANLDGSGGGNLSPVGADTDHPKAPILVASPSAVQPPSVSGSANIGSRLSCSPGGWAADLPESFLFRAASSFAYAWSENGRAVAGSSSSIIARSPGRYACQVTASNLAGSAAQSSAPIVVAARPSLSVVSVRVWPSGTITVSVGLNGAGELTGRTTFWHRRVSVLYGTAATYAAGSARLVIKPSRRALMLLGAGRRAELTLQLVFTRTDGAIARAAQPISVRTPAPARRR
jgi:hypothetical protein